MNTVMDIARYLKQNNERDYVMFTTGIYSGLRVSDILKLRVKDVRGKDYIAMREKKTKKEKRFIINKNLKKFLKNKLLRSQINLSNNFLPKQKGNKICCRTAYVLVSLCFLIFN